MAQLLTQDRMAAAIAERARVDEAELEVFGELPARCCYTTPIFGVLHGCDLPAGHSGPWHLHTYWGGTVATLAWATGV